MASRLSVPCGLASRCPRPSFLTTGYRQNVCTPLRGWGFCVPARRSVGSPISRGEHIRTLRSISHQLTHDRRECGDSSATFVPLAPKTHRLQKFRGMSSLCPHTEALPKGGGRDLAGKGAGGCTIPLEGQSPLRFSAWEKKKMPPLALPRICPFLYRWLTAQSGPEGHEVAVMCLATGSKMWCFAHSRKNASIYRGGRLLN